MKNATSLPILVTYRSAEALRDAGILYAYLKAGKLVSFATSAISSTIALWLLSINPEHHLAHPLVWLLLAIAITAGLAIVACDRVMEFPHSPRLTLDELESMKNEMGLSPQVFQRTHDSVLHASMDEIQAMKKTNHLIQRLIKSSRQPG